MMAEQLAAVPRKPARAGGLSMPSLFSSERRFPRSQVVPKSACGKLLLINAPPFTNRSRRIAGPCKAPSYRHTCTRRNPRPAGTAGWCARSSPRHRLFRPTGDEHLRGNRDRAFSEWPTIRSKLSHPPLPALEDLSSTWHRGCLNFSGARHQPRVEFEISANELRLPCSLLAFRGRHRIAANLTLVPHLPRFARVRLGPQSSP